MLSYKAIQFNKCWTILHDVKSSWTSLITQIFIISLLIYLYILILIFMQDDQLFNVPTQNKSSDELEIGIML